MFNEIRGLKVSPQLGLSASTDKIWCDGRNFKQINGLACRRFPTKMRRIEEAVTRRPGDRVSLRSRMGSMRQQLPQGVVVNAMGSQALQRLLGIRECGSISPAGFFEDLCVLKRRQFARVIGAFT